MSRGDENRLCELLTQVLAWIFLAGFTALFVWGIRVASGLSSAMNGRSILILSHAVVDFVTGLASIIVWIDATPVLIRTIATGSFGLAVAVVGAYLKPHAIYGH